MVGRELDDDTDEVKLSVLVAVGVNASDAIELVDDVSFVGSKAVLCALRLKRAAKMMAPMPNGACTDERNGGGR